MNNKIKAIGAAMIAGLVSVAAIAPVTAAPPPWIVAHHHPHFAHRGGFPGGHHYVRHYGGPAPYYGGGYYGPGYGGYDPGAAIASGLIGGVFGAIAGTALSHAGGSSHVARCESHFRTYQASTNTYMGYDGHRHVCRL